MDGKMDRTVMKANDLSEHDLLEDIRMNGNIAEIKEVKTAYYERNGQVSVIKES